jgi:hydroxymethylpyrimidine pyrophosphatase-like HAD family hydrolase
VNEPVVIATDLDRTLIFSRGAIRALGGDLPADVVETLDGRVICEMAHVVSAGLRALPSHICVVPTTTRTVEQLKGIQLPVDPQFAIAASGGVVLENGIPDQQWATMLKEELETAAPAMQARELLNAAMGSGLVQRAYTAEELFCYAIVDPAVFGVDEVAAMTEQCAPLGWRVAHQGRKLYLLPDALHKAKAIEYVVQRIAATAGGRPQLLAAGDTRLDWEMLLLADHGWVPAGSELDRSDLRAPHIAITAEPGHRGAEQIVSEWLRVATTTPHS